MDNTDFPLEAQPYSSLLSIYKNEFLDVSVDKGLIAPEDLALAGDGTPVVTSARERKRRVCDCSSKGISKCECNCHLYQPDCDVGWDSSRHCFYYSYDLYIFVASDSVSDLPVFPMLNPTSRHDSHSFLHSFFPIKQQFNDFTINKLLLDSAHDAMPIYEYYKSKGITPFTDLNEKRGIKVNYKDFTIARMVFLPVKLVLK